MQNHEYILFQTHMKQLKYEKHVINSILFDILSNQWHVIFYFWCKIYIQSELLMNKTLTEFYLFERMK